MAALPLPPQRGPPHPDVAIPGNLEQYLQSIDVMTNQDEDESDHKMKRRSGAKLTAAKQKKQKVEKPKKERAPKKPPSIKNERKISKSALKSLQLRDLDPEIQRALLQGATHAVMKKARPVIQEVFSPENYRRKSSLTPAQIQAGNSLCDSLRKLSNSKSEDDGSSEEEAEDYDRQEASLSPEERASADARYAARTKSQHDYDVACASLP
jgi:hypothetical protein